MSRLAIITTHPIQYNAPLFRFLVERGQVQIKVFYTWGDSVLQKKYDPGFEKNIEWDIPLLEGYEYSFVKNSSTNPGSHHFKGIDNPTLVEEIEEWEPNAILVFGWAFKSHLKVLRHFSGKRKIIFRGDSTLLDELSGFSVKKIARNIFLKWVYRHVDVALFVGQQNKKYYQQFGLKESQLVLAPHAIDNARFISSPSANQRQQLGIHENEIVFLFAGKLELVKNPILLLEAFIQAELQNAHLVFVGNGQLEKDLKNRVTLQNEELWAHIHFLDFQNQSQMPSIYKMADVYILPSKSETWGLAVNEAMACGKAILVSDKCGCAVDLVENGKNGYIFESNNCQDLKNKLNLLNNRSLVEEMGNQSTAIIQNWNYASICEAIEKSV